MKNINKNIQEASTLPSEFYVSESIFKQELDKVFINSWQLIEAEMDS